MNSYFFKQLKNYRPLLWINPRKGPDVPGPFGSTTGSGGVVLQDILDAEARLKRFAPFLIQAFPETKEGKGIIESPLIQIDAMRKYLCLRLELSGRAMLTGALPEGLNFYVKGDHILPVSGSIKARGGFYEVLKHAEVLALDAGLLSEEDDYSCFVAPPFRDFLAGHKIAVGSTGNLALSIGIMGAGLGFSVDVHMSAEAKEWKIKLLKEKGVRVIEHAADYSAAVAEGRRQAAADPRCHFIDDENSKDLFVGYAVAALRLREQLRGTCRPDKQGIEVSAERPLFVYLPCGVGGGPGGIAYGLRLLYGKNVHLFFCEPTHAPCMLLGLATGKHEGISVFDAGLDCRTAADGLAVGRPSGFVGRLVGPFLDGAYTVDDETMFRLLMVLHDTEGIDIEPSAAPGLIGPLMLAGTEEGRRYLKETGLEEAFMVGTHIAWLTGGGMVPPEEMAEYISRGRTAG